MKMCLILTHNVLINPAEGGMQGTAPPLIPTTLFYDFLCRQKRKDAQDIVVHNVGVELEENTCDVVQVSMLQMK